MNKTADEIVRVEAGYEIGRDDTGLTAREREVLDGLREGKTQSAIGVELGVSRARISLVVKQIREKGVRI
jgi:DNA-binding NarL/FixJ family response regulator